MNTAKKTNYKITKLIKMADNKLSWKERMDAVHKMKKYDCQEVRDVLIDIALHDRVFIVKKEAYKAAKELNLSFNGRPLFLGKKDTGYKLDDFKRIFGMIKKQCRMEKVDIKKLKVKMKELNPEMYDVISCEKGKKFDSWIRDIYGRLPKDE